MIHFIGESNAHIKYAELQMFLLDCGVSLGNEVQSPRVYHLVVVQNYEALFWVFSLG